ncbi:MAG: cation-translocating P-type ATPase [Coriobacteriales bacterium]|jgi:Cd2+/Zn2+-exporting ATPase|nr:cation-translocating P-type ATPase [Coriobacteriales bacterium]
MAEAQSELELEPTACSCCATAGCAADAETEESGRGLPWLIATGIFALSGALLHILGVEGIASYIAIAASIIGSACGLYIIFPEVIQSIRQRRVDINILMVIAVIGACVLGDFAEAGAVVFFFCIGEELEARSLRRNRESIAQLMDLTPQVVHLRQGTETLDVQPDEVALDALVVVRPGERIALDGIVSVGSASVDESPITGESVPVLKQPGDNLYSGSLSVDGRLEYRVTATVQDSTLARIVRLVEQSQAQRTPYERFINRFARYYTPLVVLLAALVFIIPPLLSLTTSLELGGFATWGYRALSLLVIACPCALVIATPVCVVTGLSRAARSGVLVKGGAFLELAARVRAVAFDKTGTLTYGKPTLEEVLVLPAAVNRWQDAAADQVLALAAALEADSTHPLANAVLAAARQRQLAWVAPDRLSETAGKGIAAELDGLPAAVGSPGFASEYVQLDQRCLADIAAVEQAAATALVVLFDSAAVGILAVRDVVRPQSQSLTQKLSNEQGIKTVMLTGDNLATATAIASEAGISLVHAGLLPEEKMAYINRLKQQYGVVAMVGDGINDAPALAAADIGIAMGAAGSDTALEVADIALMADNIAELPMLFKLARKVIRTIHTNIAFAIIIKAAVMILAIIGVAQMWMAIFADVGVLLLVLLYSMRLNLPVRP